MELREVIFSIIPTISIIFGMVWKITSSIKKYHIKLEDRIQHNNELIRESAIVGKEQFSRLVEKTNAHELSISALEKKVAEKELEIKEIKKDIEMLRQSTAQMSSQFKSEKELDLMIENQVIKSTRRQNENK